MKATIDFDERLYRRLKIEAARRGRSIRELVADAVTRHLDAAPFSEEGAQNSAEWSPKWLGSLARYSAANDDHSMSSIRESVARARVSKKAK